MTQAESWQALGEQVGAIINYIENEKAIRLDPGLPLVSSNLKDVQSAHSSIMRRCLGELPKPIEDRVELLVCKSAVLTPA